MRRILMLFLTLTVMLSLTACRKAEEAPASSQQGAVSAAPAGPEAPEEGFTTVTGAPFVPAEVETISLSGQTMEGVVPEGEYDLPAEVVAMRDWDGQGIAMLARLPQADAAFYAVEGKESYPALIRWGGSIAEFDWLYATSRAIPPQMWCFDFDGDGEDELVVDCYGGSGTGMSIEYLYVVERREDGTLTSCHLSWPELREAVSGCLWAAKAGQRTYAALGRELVDITAELEGQEPKYQNSGLAMGQVVGFERTEAGMTCTMGAVLDAEELYYWYVADVTADVIYKDGTFLLDDLHLDGY